MKQTLSCIMDIGEQMLISGAEVHRVEESIQRMCIALGAERIDVFIITSSMVATLYTKEGDIYTQTRRIMGSGTDFEKIHRLNELSRRICKEKPSLTEIQAELKRAIACKKYPFWAECVAYAVIAGAFTLFFGGSIIESVVSVVIGIAVRFCILFSDRTVSNKVFAKFFSACMATALSIVSLRLGIIQNVDKVMIGNIMTLIPGVGLTNALRDLFVGDSIAGLLRTIEAVLTALAIAAGYFLVSAIGGAL